LPAALKHLVVVVQSQRVSLLSQGCLKCPLVLEHASTVAVLKRVITNFQTITSVFYLQTNCQLQAATQAAAVCGDSLPEAEHLCHWLRAAGPRLCALPQHGPAWTAAESVSCQLDNPRPARPRQHVAPLTTALGARDHTSSSHPQAL